MDSGNSKFKIIKDRKEWQYLLSKVLFKTFFHDLKWEEFLEINFKWLKFKHYLYKDEALLSLAKYKIFSRERLISHPFCEYGGPLPLKNEIEGREFRNAFFLKFKNPFKISFHPQLAKYFKNLGLKETDSSRDTYFIENFDKKTAQVIFSSFRKTLRHSIKKAQDQDFRIKKCESENELKELYKIYLKTTKRNKTIPYPFSFFQYFLNSSNSEIILAKFKNKIIAGSLFLFYPIRSSETKEEARERQFSKGVCKKIIHYFLNASEEKYKDYNTNHLILWKQIENYARKNYEVFDLGGTRRGSRLEIFKRGWGTKRYPIFELRNYPEDKLKESKLRNVLSLLPPFLLKEISPHLLKYKL